MTADTPRTPTAIDRIAEDWVDTLVELEPTLGTYIGRTEVNDRFGDLSPAGHDAVVDAGREAPSPSSSPQRPSTTSTRSRRPTCRASCALAIESHDARLHLRDLNVIASPCAGDPRGLRPHADGRPSTTGRRSTSASAPFPPPSTATSRPCAQGIREGVTPAKRQVREVLAQARKLAANDGFFAELRRRRELADGDLPASLAKQLAAGAGASRRRLRRARRLPRRTSSCPRPRERDAVGREHLRAAVAPLPRRRPSTSTRPTSGASRSSPA